MGVTERLLAQIYGLRAENARLEKEADWLAFKAWKKSDSDYLPEHNHNCWECPYEHDCVKCWREAARKAIEVENEANSGSN